MTRSSLRPIASVGLVVAVLTYVGCARTHETSEKVAGSATSVSSPENPTETPATTEIRAGSADEKIPKFMADWSKNPPVGILLISGEQLGYPDPCGCTDGQLGGLGRRFDLLEKIQARGWPTAKIDLGNLIRLRGDSRGGRDQEKIKFDIILEALGMMDYSAVAMGPEDLRLGVMETVGTLLNSQPPKFPVFLAANIKPQQGLESTISAVKFTKAGPISIGITSVIDPSTIEELLAQTPGVLEVKSPDEVIPGALEELKKQAQIKVLMVEGPHEEARRLAEKFPGFDIVVGTSDFEEPDEHAQMTNNGQTLLVDNIGRKGKYVGLVGFFPGSKPMIQFRRQALDHIHFHQAEPMRKLIDFDYQDRLKQARVVENFPRSSNGQSPGATYVGAEACQSCHPKTFEKWTTTKHAKAYEALTNPKRNRIYDAECISCHTTGFGYKTGWVSESQTPLLKGNQCENCHGPASLHVSDPDNLAYRKPMAMSREMAQATNFCTKCHDEDNDHNFTFDNRYAQIFHKGLDVYDDPKVHQKTPPKVAAESK